jgi:hypothetical protein
MSFKVGDSVKVKDAIMCPDDDSVCIGGWQGRISEIEDDGIVEISWDSITLRQLPDDYIRQSENEGLVGHRCIYLSMKLNQLNQEIQKHKPLRWPRRWKIRFSGLAWAKKVSVFPK